MIPVYQTDFRVPGGNCLQAALASIMELPLEEVPHFANIESDDWWKQCQDWCTQFDVYPIYATAKAVEDPSAFQGYHLIAVKTVNGHDHVVVGRNGEIVHDPVPSGAKPSEITGYILFVSTMEKIDLRENLAGYAHEAWSGWMRYMFSKEPINAEGTWTMPAWAVERWQRQMNTLYTDLPESEKQSDREEADKILAVISEGLDVDRQTA